MFQVTTVNMRQNIAFQEKRRSLLAALHDVGLRTPKDKSRKIAMIRALREMAAIDIGVSYVVYADTDGYELRSTLGLAPSKAFIERSFSNQFLKSESNS